MSTSLSSLFRAVVIQLPNLKLTRMNPLLGPTKKLAELFKLSTLILIRRPSGDWRFWRFII